VRLRAEKRLPTGLRPVVVEAVVDRDRLARADRTDEVDRIGSLQPRAGDGHQQSVHCVFGTTSESPVIDDCRRGGKVRHGGISARSGVRPAIGLHLITGR
jgi:hypothetical protein